MVDIAKRINIIIMDDDLDWCETISETARFLGHNPDAVTSLEVAHAKIQEAYSAENPYEVAVIDLNFETGKEKINAPRGKQILRFIKTRHPYMACIIVSGVSTNASNILDLRDDYGLDYYIEKDRFDLDTFSNAVEKSLRRVEPVAMDMLRVSNLEKIIKEWEKVRIVLLGDLASVQKRAALKGINVDVGTENEIIRYEKHLTKVEEQIAELKEELKD